MNFGAHLVICVIVYNRTIQKETNYCRWNQDGQYIPGRQGVLRPLCTLQSSHPWPQAATEMLSLEF